MSKSSNKYENHQRIPQTHIYTRKITFLSLTQKGLQVQTLVNPAAGWISYSNDEHIIIL